MRLTEQQIIDTIFDCLEQCDDTPLESLTETEEQNMRYKWFTTAQKIHSELIALQGEPTKEQKSFDGMEYHNTCSFD